MMLAVGTHIHRLTIYNREISVEQQIRMLKYDCYRIKQTFGKQKYISAP